MIFAKLLDMSISASILIVAVIVLRLLLKSAPKWIRCVMWALVATRLVLPFSFESPFSLIPNTNALSTVHNLGTTQNAVNTLNSSDVQSTSSAPSVMTIIGIVWACGVAIMLVYMLISYIRLRKKLSESIKLENNIWICDRISSPFVLGFFNPKIYLLSSIDKKSKDYVVAHEQAHIQRLDYIWKPLGFLLLSVYWFNPLCWIAYVLFNKDIELSCDEKVIKGFDVENKKEYSSALLLCSTGRHIMEVCPIAFGEVSVKQRIKNVLSYKKPAFWIIAVAFVSCFAVAMCFMTNPISKTIDKSLMKHESLDNAVKEVDLGLLVPSTTAPQTTAPLEQSTTASITKPEKEQKDATEPEPTQAQSDDTTDYYDNSYDNSSYDDNSYYDNSYDDNSNSDNSSSDNMVPDNLVEITPFESSYDDSFAQGNREILDDIENNSLSDDDNEDNVFQWDLATN